MPQQDYCAIRDALLELGLALVWGKDDWTYEQRLIYEKATSTLERYRKLGED